uniref:Acid-sensing ion channel 1 n=1 Tax=Strongyloides stercoralis TaxID=6248 RepID=A0A0K0DVS3_STRER
MIYECSLSNIKKNYRICQFCKEKFMLTNDIENFENHICDFHAFDDIYPPWIYEFHGVRQIFSKKCFIKKFFWIILLIFCIGVTFLTIFFIVKKYKEGETSTFISVKIVPSLELPALTICPDSYDILNIIGIYNEIQAFHSNITINEVKDLIQYFLAGNGIFNMKRIKYFTRDYLEYIEVLYTKWSKNYSNYDFFFYVHKKYGLKCEELFRKCYYHKKIENCCKNILKPIPVLGRGICFQTIKGLKQQDEDDIGKLLLEMNAPFVNHKNKLNNNQSKLVVFVNSDFDVITTGHPIFIFPNVYNTFLINAKRIKLIEKNMNCANEIEGNNNICFLKNFLKSKIIGPYNCIFSYLKHIYFYEKYPICNLSTIIHLYYENPHILRLPSKSQTKCIPGCNRWQYFTTLQVGNMLTQFSGYHFNLEMSYLNLQYEQITESYTTSIPTFIAEIGGQLGLFLGISVITLLQIIIYLYKKIIILLFARSSYNE